MSKEIDVYHTSIWERFPKLKEIPKDKFPNHVLIIPDGNARYAQLWNQPPLFGHEKGYRTIETVLKDLRELPIKYVTVWGLSSDNITNRKPEELEGIITIIKFAIESNIDDLLKNNVKFQCIGRRDRISKELVETIENAEEKTESSNGQVLSLAIDYNGQTEQLFIMQEIVNRQYPPDTVITPQLRDDLLNAYRKGLPPADAVFRTVEPNDARAFRTSGIGDIVAEAVEVNIPKLLPQTTTDDFINAIVLYTEIKRRFGGRPTQTI